MKCILSSVYTMKADILSQYHPGLDDDDAETGGDLAGTGNTGHFEYVQDPDSGALIRKWFPNPVDPNVPDQDTGNFPDRAWEMDCIARAIIDGGIRVAGTTERFLRRGMIETVDFVSIKFPSNVMLTRRDRVTNIRDARTGRVLWVEEELAGKATVFEVNGVSPVIDPFGRHVENSALLQRAEIQVESSG